ncbi:hypothetical protein HETIRDRAFT_223342, partial [Heterobasidion irregulare TC 32-1]|uniref:Uncharacterized protein n=1 Tax=Heterobasidion irregulare (strain TC 32-1) TaxID=747525 RepID=W4JZ27_HETIT
MDNGPLLVAESKHCPPSFNYARLPAHHFGAGQTHPPTATALLRLPEDTHIQLSFCMSHDNWKTNKIGKPCYEMAVGIQMDGDGWRWKRKRNDKKIGHGESADVMGLHLEEKRGQRHLFAFRCMYRPSRRLSSCR